MTPLPDNFVPTCKTVILGRGKKILAHPGNLFFKDVVATQLDAYLAAESRIDKTAILMKVIMDVRDCKPGGGFVKLNPKTGQYFEVNDFLAKEKTAQAFRDALHEYYSSSNPSKRKRRVEESSIPPTIIPAIGADMTNAKLSDMKNSQSPIFSRMSSVSPVARMPEISMTENPRTSPPPHFGNNTLVTMMQKQILFGSTRSFSAPTSPFRSSFFPDKEESPEKKRASTPPPNFSRFVSINPSFQRISDSNMHDSFATKRKRQSSVLFLGDTLAEFSAAIESDTEDDFEPIPLDRAMSDDVGFLQCPPGS